MISAPMPNDEIQRISALLSYDILDTAPEPLFDDLTTLASMICDTPISLVSLVDANRQWFKAVVGLEVSETPRDVSFCGHALAGHDIFVVQDARADARFADNPLVTGYPSVRFYAGAPLVNQDGYVLGTLCVIDHKPRQLAPDQAKALSALSRQVVALIEARKASAHAMAQFNALKRASQTLLEYEQRLLTASRMAAVGEMAGGVAHEINNPLMVVMGTIALLNDRIATGRLEAVDLTAGLEKLDRMAKRVAAIVNALLAFSGHRHTKNQQLTDIDAILNNVMLLCSERFAAGGVALSVETTNSALQCDSIQIEQVLINLLNNSYFAVRNLSSRWVKIVAGPIADDEIAITVTDSGRGIDPKVAHKIMEPFFTTRAIGEGVGLGLSISKGLVEAHRGRIHYDDTKPNTTFSIVLPRSSSRNEQGAM